MLNIKSNSFILGETAICVYTLPIELDIKVKRVYNI